MHHETASAEIAIGKGERFGYKPFAASFSA
jgi:hypothetical protein